MEEKEEGRDVRREGGVANQVKHTQRVTLGRADRCKCWVSRGKRCQREIQIQTHL